MSNYNSVSDLLLTIANADHIVDHVAHDDDSIMVATNIDWFTFNNVIATNVYVSGNSWIGIGTNSESSGLKVNRRDAKLWDLWTETGIVGTGTSGTGASGTSIFYHYYRVRWGGYSRYNSTSDSAQLIWDCVLLDDSRIYLNIVQWPTDYADGTNALVTASTCSYAPSTTALQFTFSRSDTAGTIWTVQSGILEPDYTRTLYLYSDEQKFIYYYSATDRTMTKIPDLKRTTLTGQAFSDHGSALVAPWNLIKSSLTKPVILKWRETGAAVPINAKLSGVPIAQTISSVVDLNSSTIKGIKSFTAVYEGNITISYSLDNQVWTNEITMADFLALDVNTIYSSLTSEKKIYFRIKLNDSTAIFTNFVMEFQN